jgi:hypothetical protein
MTQVMLKGIAEEATVTLRAVINAPHTTDRQKKAGGRRVLLPPLLGLGITCLIRGTGFQLTRGLRR